MGHSLERSRKAVRLTPYRILTVKVLFQPQIKKDAVVLYQALGRTK